MIYQLRYTVAASAMAITVVAIGCGTEQRPVGTTMTTSAGWVPISDATQKFAADRCEWEAACNNVGQGRKFSDSNVCLSESQRKLQSELGTAGCARAIDAGEFAECLQAVHDERCEQSLDSVTRLKACRAEKLCVQLQRGSLGG